MLTSSVKVSFSSFCVSRQLPPSRLIEVFGTPAGAQLLGAIERGEIDDAQFERELAPLLGPLVNPEGTLDALAGGLEQSSGLLASIGRLRGEGVKTLLVSNSFGRSWYRAVDIESTFDAAILSGQLGIRKPSRAIYRAALETGGVTADEAIFIDDLEINLEGARRVGIAGYLHTDEDSTIRLLTEVFGVPASR